MEYKIFVPRKTLSLDDWKQDCKDKIKAFSTYEKAGSKSREDLELFMCEAVWASMKGDLSVARVAEVFQQTNIKDKAALQKALIDVLWLLGFAAEGTTKDTNWKEDYQSLLQTLEQKASVQKHTLASGLEMESVPAAVCKVEVLKKKHNQAKTKARYTITRYNLLRDHTEGYARLLYFLDHLTTLDFEPAAKEEEIAQSKKVLIEDVIRLIGVSHLCPNRIASMTLDIYEQRLIEAGPGPMLEPLVDLLRRLPRQRLTEVVVFQLTAHLPAPVAGKDPPKTAPPARPGQLMAIASLISLGLVDLETLWTYLEPADSVIKQAWSDMMAKYEDEVGSFSKCEISGSSSKPKDQFARLMQAFNQLTNQKILLLAALISVNDWRSSTKVLTHMSRICKPAMNHYIRTALADLLKWVIQPAMVGEQKKLPGAKKPSLIQTFSAHRCFEFGLWVQQRGAVPAVSPEDAANALLPSALTPAADLDTMLPHIKQVLGHLEYFLHTDMYLLSSLWKLLLISHTPDAPAPMAVEKVQTGNSKASSSSSSITSPPTVGEVTLDDPQESVIYRHLLPAVSLVAHNPSLTAAVWALLSKLSVFQRFRIYSCWENMYSNFLLKFVQEKTKQQAKQILKRVVSNAIKSDIVAAQSHFHINKLCHSNPIPVIEIMLQDIEIGFNVNMIQPYVECTNRCSEMAADVVAFVISRSCSRPTTPMKPFLNQADATISSWLTNLAEFIGRFYKKHPSTDLVGLLSLITKRINNDAGESAGGAGAEYKGESLIRVVLENLIEHLGGHIHVADMSAEQLHALAGGPCLRSESVSFGRKEDQRQKDKNRQTLVNVLVDLGLVQVLWQSLSQQRHHFLSQEFSEVHTGGGGLKLLGLLFDGNHECFLKITDFVAQALSRDKYKTLLPPIKEVFTMFEPALAFLIIRHGLVPYAKGTAAALAAAAAALPAVAAPPDGANGTAASGATPEAAAASPPATAPTASPTAAPTTLQIDGEEIVELEKVVHLYIPPKFEVDESLSMQFYLTFWRLSLQDIVFPEETYKKSTDQLKAQLKQLEVTKKGMEREKDYQYSKDYKALKKEAVRITDLVKGLELEHKQQKLNHNKVKSRLEVESKSWFVKPSPTATASFVADMICPRVLTSYSDALFCAHFVRLLVQLKTPGFQLLDFYNNWTTMLTQCIRSCTEREAQIFGVFLRELMSYILHLRSSEAAYNTESKDNPCFHRHYPDPSGAAAETAAESKEKPERTNFQDIKKGHSKWEGRIYKALKGCFDSEDWMEKRNALHLLGKSCESFPVVEKYATATLRWVDNLKDTKEEFVDVKTLANSLATKIRSLQQKWVDKAPPPKAAPKPAATASKDVKDPAATSKSASAAKPKPAAADTAAQSKSTPSAPPAAASAAASAAPRPAEPKRAGNSTKNALSSPTLPPPAPVSTTKIKMTPAKEVQKEPSKRPAETAAGSDSKRPRREEEAKPAAAPEDREPKASKDRKKDGKEAKESKEAKRDRPTEKSSKEARDPKDSRSEKSSRHRTVR